MVPPAGPRWGLAALGALALTSRELCDEMLRNPAFGVRARAAASQAGGRPRSGHPRHRRAVKATLHRILDGLDGRDRFDLVADVAQPFPVAVIADLMGVPLEDPARFAHLGHVVGQGLDGVASLRQAAELRRASAEMAALFEGLGERRAREPSDDVVGVLAAAAADGRITLAGYVASWPTALPGGPGRAGC